MGLKKAVEDPGRAEREVEKGRIPYRRGRGNTLDIIHFCIYNGWDNNKEKQEGTEGVAQDTPLLLKVVP